jgi:general nucleoside transport system ATP-binding protein
MRGAILIDGEQVHFNDPGDAIAAGIGMVHQHFMLVPVFTVAENILLGKRTPRPLPALRSARGACVRSSASRRTFGLPVDPGRASSRTCPVGLQQRVEILKALSRDARLLILDEPTAVLTPQEADGLFASIRGFQDPPAGRSSSSPTSCASTGTSPTASPCCAAGAPSARSTRRRRSPRSSRNMMVGRPVVLVVERGPADPGEPVLSVEGLEVVADGGQRLVDGVDLTVHRGEILAIAGVEGNGQTPLVEAITGLITPTAGSIRLGERELTGLSRKEILRSGVGHIPEDRSEHGLVGSFSIADNLVLNLWDEERFAAGRTRRFDAIEAHARRVVEAFDVRTPSIFTPASSLSGGNQQKVIVAREFDRPIDVLVAAQPTRGIDVGSIEYIHQQLVAKRDSGVGVLLVSSELDEVIALADRVAVMFRGRLLGPFPAPVAKEALGLMMAGVSPEEALDGRAA